MEEDKDGELSGGRDEMEESEEGWLLGDGD